MFSTTNIGKETNREEYINFIKNSEITIGVNSDHSRLDTLKNDNQLAEKIVNLVRAFKLMTISCKNIDNEA